jgi:hypothetical protein
VNQLPANLLTDSVWPIRGGETGCLGGIRGGAQGVRAHMWDGCGLSGRSGGGRCRGIADLASGTPILKTAADLFRDAKLATGKGSRASDRLSGAAIPWGFRLEQSQHPPRAVRRPSRHDPPIGFAERLRRSHTPIVPRLPALAPRAPREAEKSLSRRRWGVAEAKRVCLAGPALVPPARVRLAEAGAWSTPS